MVPLKEVAALYNALALPAIIPKSFLGKQYATHADVVKEAWAWYFQLRGILNEPYNSLVLRIPVRTIEWQKQFIRNGKSRTLKQ